MKNLLLFTLFITCTIYKAQPVSISVAGIKSSIGYLYSLKGENTFLIDSIKSSSDGTFNYQFDRSMHPGFYRITFQKHKWIDFVFDKETVSLKTYAENILNSMRVLSSESNRAYYEFVKLNRLYKIKTELLQFILTRYPKDDEFYNTTLDRFRKLQTEYDSFVLQVLQNQPNSFIVRYIRSARLSVVDITLPLEQQLKYFKSHALDNVNFNDSQLIYSDLFTNKTIEYLTYYRNPQLTKEQLELEFMSAVDTLLNKAMVNQLVYQHITEYLIAGFKSFGFDKIIDYIVESYVIKDDLCLDTKTESSIQRRIDQNKKLPVSSIIPEIILPDTAGHEVALSNIKTDKVLVLFYASWCPHCQILLTQLKELYKSQMGKSMEILAIALDNNRTDWINFIKANNLNWLNISDLKGWDSKAVTDYYVYATPTMFLVDKNRTILGKPLTIDELKRLL